MNHSPAWKKGLMAWRHPSHTGFFLHLRAQIAGPEIESGPTWQVDRQPRSALAGSGSRPAPSPPGRGRWGCRAGDEVMSGEFSIGDTHFTRGHSSLCLKTEPQLWIHRLFHLPQNIYRRQSVTRLPRGPSNIKRQKRRFTCWGQGSKQVKNKIVFKAPFH